MRTSARVAGISAVAGAGTISAPGAVAPDAPLMALGAFASYARHGNLHLAPAAYLRARQQAFADDPETGAVAAHSEGDVTLWAVAEYPAFERSVLGRRVGRLRDVFLHGGDRDSLDLGGHVAGVTIAIAGAGLELLLAECWGGETSLQDALRVNGFSAGATKLRWVRDAAAVDRAGALRSRYSVRPAGAADLAHLLPLAQRFGPGQFSGVDSVQPGQITDYYAAWMSRAWRGEFADEVLVAEGRSGPCAFASFKLRRDLLEVTGRRIMGGGLAAVARGAEGALIDLMREMMARVDGGDYDGVELDMYAGNSAAQRCLDAFGFRHVDTARVMWRDLAGRWTAAR